ncbi:cytochrome c oxidase subunit II [Arsenicitalea aurantiaca]|uniref:Cytochrome c oxidase subunit 2 n=2 Tax=Arsenicitalea aurantiaca TaxID=1783274 RepID=A0A433XBI6_9HYPH|nr:cytochrome c oxidase subunit II [Arsenicitalea aurantiaca]
MALPGAALAQTVAVPGESYAAPGQIGLMSSVTPIQDSIISFHNGILLITITLITLLVLALLVVVVLRFNAKANPKPSSVTHNTLIEVVWTVAPILILVVIAIPSFGVLTDQMTTPDGERRYLGANIFSFGEVEVPAPELTVKATGAQWYWIYEYVDEGQAFDSAMLREPERLAEKPNQPRLLAVDNELVVPVDTTVRVEVTASDVIHAFAVPAFGIKTDAVPGRLNETWFHARKTGIYYGQCSELCGKDHAYMPIAVRVVTQDEYAAWIEALRNGNVIAANAVLEPIT